jgi:hypothetical protein
MENNTDNLKRLIEKLKTCNFFDRLFRWNTIKSLLVDAASEVQGLLANFDGVKFNLTRIETEKSEITY